MQTKFNLTRAICIFILISISTAIIAKTTTGTGIITGKITDAASGLPIAGVTVSFPDLKTGSVTDTAGNYVLNQLPKGAYLIQVTSVGYAGKTLMVDLAKTHSLDFQLSASNYELSDVVVTALGNTTSKQRAPVPVTVVTHDMLLEQAATNAIDAIAKQPGITEITEGPGISKPEINGLGYNRVLTLMDGERQEDMQWGDEHGILIDPYATYDAEIIRGAASLQYGANAIAGVISFKSQPAYRDGTTWGSVESEYQTNNGLIGNTIDIGGNNNGLVWDIRGSYENAHCYSDPNEGYVWGTAFLQSNVRAMIGLNKSWGYSRLSVSVLHRRIEVPDGNRDSTTRRFEFDTPIGAQYVNGVPVPGTGQIYPTKANFLSYKPDIAGDQILDHDEVWWQNSFNLGKGKIEADIGYTQSIRDEIDTGTIGASHLIVHDIPYSFKYKISGDSSGMKFTAGLNGMYEFENNYPEPPAPYIAYSEIPAYKDFDIGGYAILEKDYKNLTLSTGLRYDLRSITGLPMDLVNYDTPQQQQVPAGTPGAYQQYAGFHNNYLGLSGSIGAAYQLPENYFVKLNFAKSYRAPSIDELNSNSLNGGSNAYILGYTGLKAEQGYEADMAVGNNSKDLSFEVDGFYNYIHNFIFQGRLANKTGRDSILLGYPVFRYQANTAIIAGVTANFNIHPAVAKWIEFDNGFTYIYSFMPNQTDSTQHVPLTPAPRLTSAIKFKLTDKPNSIMKRTFFAIGLEHDWAQNNIYSELHTELPSYNYTLFNAGIGTNFVSRSTKRTVCSLYINCTNLMNIAYVDHLSHNQYFWASNGGTPNVVTKQSEGIYNMGRNIGFKLVIPF